MLRFFILFFSHFLMAMQLSNKIIENFWTEGHLDKQKQTNMTAFIELSATEKQFYERNRQPLKYLYFCTVIDANLKQNILANNVL